MSAAEYLTNQRQEILTELARLSRAIADAQQQGASPGTIKVLETQWKAYAYRHQHEQGYGYEY